jgi:hypothetical protein
MFPVNKPDDNANIDTAPKALVENCRHQSFRSFDTILVSINDIEYLRELLGYADMDIHNIQGLSSIALTRIEEKTGISAQEYKDQAIAAMEANKDLIKARIKKLEVI